jgi:alpha-galactosidase
MSLWCLMASPLHVSCDIRTVDATSLETLLNREILAINQDALGRQARRAIKDRQIEIWKKPLANGDCAIGILNRGAAATEVKLRWTDIALAPKGTLRDLWAHKDLGAITETITLPVASHETRVLRYSPAR